MLKCRSLDCVAIVVVALAGTVPCEGEVVLDHQPGSIGLGNGPASDTLFPSPVGAPIWSQLADDFVLGSAALVRRVGWWGFYGGSFGEASPNPPAGDESMRVRFYGARPSDGLPDASSILYEQTMLNPSRAWTGRILGNQREFYFEGDLLHAVPLAAGTTYWFEVVQLDDFGSLFRWEYSHAEWNGFAFISYNVPNWTLVPPADLSFRLSTIPEPGTIAMFFGVVLLLFGSRSEKWRHSRASKPMGVRS